MSKSLRIALWNANGLTQHKDEITIFFHQYVIDILLISDIPKHSTINFTTLIV